MLEELSRNVDVSFKNKTCYFYPCCVLEQQHMLIINFIIIKILFRINL
jgi:hypothetical protein